MICLASASPRRKALLEQIGVPVTVMPCDIDETVQAGEEASVYVERMAREKAEAACSRVSDQVVVAADTVVVCGDRVLGKPADREQALATLRLLSGNQHRVMTAVAVRLGQRHRLIRVDTRVHFRTLGEAEMSAYWDTGEPADKAGSYAIQGRGAVFVERIDGSYSAVVGLPLMETAAVLAGFGVSCWQSVAQNLASGDHRNGTSR
ncbi:septum formation protein [Halopseudomonas xinjiangensis]|uniref:dTTP/UTP pyrophosphatase n=1 Tax=Halopseudomonas xinjiangensis TaxID=487184 RepID=A0A1H1VX38_9GAMM|nr:Maf family protein [Halopseudomonas xinjiangensis]SDS88990.1 septum formation protein [Halopseudomonas xinjiangensis]